MPATAPAGLGRLEREQIVLTADQVIPLLAAGANSPLLSGAAPLDSRTKRLMESRFGYGFDEVRVHTGELAAAAAHALCAQAFALGQDVFFAHGQYEPYDDAGCLLLAHELIHVIQQRGISRFDYQNCAGVGEPDDALELEAERLTQSFLAPSRLPRVTSDHLVVVRRVIRVDPASVSMTVDKGVTKAKAAVDVIPVQGQTKIAVGHLTAGIDLKRAGTNADLDAIVVDPVIKMTGKANILGDAGDDVNTTNLNLNFIQIGTIFQLEDTFAGERATKGTSKCITGRWFGRVFCSTAIPRFSSLPAGVNLLRRTSSTLKSPALWADPGKATARPSKHPRSFKTERVKQIISYSSCERITA